VRLSTRDSWIVVGTLAVLVLAAVPTLGDEEWPFRPGRVHPTGLFGFVVRAAHERWDLGLLRSAGMLGAVLVAALAVVVLVHGALAVRTATVVAFVVACLLLLPAVVLQAGLRQSTAPWFFTNDSTYQIELAGKLVRHGTSPYGHDYTGSGLERFYALDGSATTDRVALHHFAYFPGSALVAAAWGVLPKPLSDFRFLVVACALGLFGAAFLFPGPPGVRIAAGAALAANPLLVQAGWFGTADAPSLLLVAVAFALLARKRPVEAAAALGAALLLKQFAVVAVPFAVLLVPRERWRTAALAFAGVFVLGVLPFAVSHPHALWSDTITYGTNTYPIVGYGLSSLLLRAHALSSRTGFYPFAELALVVWLPITVFLVRAALRRREPWIAAAGFAVSIFTLLFVARVFQTSYLAWPLTGALLALLLSASAATPRPSPGRGGPAPTR
jgi:uncharacterized membrane protein